MSIALISNLIKEEFPKNYLFKNGQLSVGLVSTTYRPSNRTGQSGRAGTYTIEYGKLVLEQTATAAGVTSWFTDPIDVTGINSITFKIDSITSGVGNTVSAGITNKFEDAYTYANLVTCNTAGNFTVDTSAKTGNWRFYLYMSTSQTTERKITISEMYVNES